MLTSSLDYTRHGSVGLITLSRPAALNALDEATLTTLESVLDEVEADPTLGALALTGTERAFCVGLDLDLLARAFDDIGYFETVVRRLNALVTRLEALPIPTIAAVNGFARAGGFELTLGCDFMVIAEKARIGDVHTDAGVVPACVSLRLARRVGEQRAKEILWTARWLSGAEAVAYGLAIKAVPLAELLPAVLGFAETMIDKPRAALASIKSVFQQGRRDDVAAGAALELDHFVRYMSNEPYGREGFLAFRERRLPSWRADPA